MKPPVAADDADFLPPGLYDGTDEDDLWFLPPDDNGGDAASELAPLPRADRRPLFDPLEWRTAEAALAPDLAALAFDAGRLAERLTAMPGAAERIALQEAAGISWWAGDRIGADRLALWMIQREGATGADAQGVARAAWAARRLPAPRDDRLAWPARLAGHLGRDGDRIDEAAEALFGMDMLHPATTAAAGFHLWRLLAPRETGAVEAAVLAARLAAGVAGPTAAPGALTFLPVTLAGFGALSASGSAERRLSGFLTGAHQAILSALMTLDRLRRWQHRAAEVTADLSGRTPARLIDTLSRLPMVSAPVAERETGASRAAVQRNLETLTSRGLIREITGQGRFRVWAAGI